MTTHLWGEQGVDWQGIDAAANYLGTFCRRWGRIGGQTKEKYGTVRFYVHFSGLSLHDLVYPGYCYSQFPKWLWKLDIYHISPILEKLLGKPVFAWRKFIYSTAYRRALKKWPHLASEILVDADYPEFIKGCCRIEGNSKHIINPQTGEILSTWTTHMHAND